MVFRAKLSGKFSSWSGWDHEQHLPSVSEQCRCDDAFFPSGMIHLRITVTEQDGLHLYQIQFGEYRSGSRPFLRCDMDVLAYRT